jgi:hypothetical protein
MQTHKLKTINPYFTAVWRGFKKFEVRKNDRDFKEGDKVHLLEYEAETDNYTGREIRGEITYVLKDYEAVKDGYVVFAFTKNTHIANGEVQ